MWRAASLALVFVVAALAPLLASKNPDGLESTAQKFESAQGRETHLLPALFPDYTLPGGGGTAAEAAVMLAGTALVFLLSMASARLLARLG